MVKRKLRKLDVINKDWVIGSIISIFFLFILLFFVSADGTGGSGSGYGFLVELQTPENDSVEFDGNVTFSYGITNSSYLMNNCSFIFNGAVNQTKTNISSSSTNYFYLNSLQNGVYNWSVNCSWSDGFNISNSEDRVLNVLNDTTSPTVSLQTPSDEFDSTDRTIQFNYTVNDDGWITNCSIYTNISGTWGINQTNYFIIKNMTLSFDINNVPDDSSFKWNILCYDFASSPNSAWATSNRTASIDNPPPVLSELSPQSWVEDSIKIINLSSYVSDSDSDDLTYNSSSPTHISVELDENTGMVILTPETNWYGSENITFYISDSDGEIIEDNVLLTVTQEGDTAPRFISISPDSNYTDNDGYFFLTPNVTDDYALVNVSLYSNTNGSWQLEETKELTGMTNWTTFNLTNISEGAYTYAFLVYDNSSLETWSENRTITVNKIVNLEHDIGNYTVNHVDHNRTVLVSYSSYLDDSIVIGDLNIYLSNGSLYLNKNLSGNGFEFNLTDPPLTVYLQKIMIKYDEILHSNFMVGNDDWINISLDYSYLGNSRQISTKHTIEVIE